MLITSDDMITDIETDKRLNPLVTELSSRGRFRLVLFRLVWLSILFESVKKTIRLNATHYFTVKLHKKRDRQRIASKQSYYIYMKV